MTQTIILKKWTAFSKIKKLEYHRELEKKRKRKRFRTELAVEKLKFQQKQLKKDNDHLVKKLKVGHCFSFSLNYGIQHRFGKRLFWKDVLQKNATWDENPELLTQIITLPHASPNTKKETLGDWIDFMMNAVIPMQGEEIFSPANITQYNMLNPRLLPSLKKNERKSYVEYLHNGVIHSIQTYEIVAGTFSKEKLIDILSEHSLRQAIILVNGELHTLYLGWNAGLRWLLYDPNNDHRCIEKMEIHGTLEKCIDEIFHLLGNALSFQIASFDPNIKFELSAWKKIVETDFDSLVKENGILQMADYTPDKLIIWLEKMDQSSDSRNSAVDQFKHVFTKPWGESNGLRTIINCEKNILTILLKMAKNSVYYETMSNNIAAALKENDNWEEEQQIVLVTLISEHPSHLLPMLDFLVKDEKSLISTLDLLTEKNEKSETIWQIIDRNALPYRCEVINFFIKKMTGIDYNFYKNLPQPSEGVFSERLLSALLLKLPFKNIDHGFEVIIHTMPEILPIIVKFALATSAGFDILMQAFYTRSNYARQNNWEKLSSNAIKTTVMNLLSQHIHQMDEERLNKQFKKLPAHLSQNTSRWILDCRATDSRSLAAFLQQEVAIARLRFKPAPRIATRSTTGLRLSL